MKQKIQVVLFLFFALLLNSCATVSSTSKGTEKTYHVECDGKLVSMDVCYKKAQQLCPNGYKVLDQKAKDCSQYLPAVGTYTSCEMANKIFSTDKSKVLKGINIQCK